MKKLLTIGAVAMFATPAFAANNIFSCTAENGSPVSVTKMVQIMNSLMARFLLKIR